MVHDALQCGFCTPGFIVEAAAFHDRWRAAKGTATPSREEIGAALSGHLCRCGAYDGIFSAVAAACTGQFDGGDIISPRVEARDKVTGAAKYTVDIRHDRQLEGIILRSQIAHGKIGELDLAAALAMPGVGAAISLLAEDRIVRFVGQPIAAVAAKDARPRWRRLPPSGDPASVCRRRLASMKRASPMRRSCSKKPTAEKTGNVSEGGGSPAPWKGNIRGPSANRRLRKRCRPSCGGLLSTDPRALGLRASSR